MTNIPDSVRAHYDSPDLLSRIRAALAPIAREGEPLTVPQLATLDQFHTRGIVATSELAAAADVKRTDRVLDIGCGVGGPARYLAATFGCHVAGVDLSPSFIEAATYLTARCGLDDRTSFRVGDALDLPFEAGEFDATFLQHVAMNIADRARLYAEVRRVLKSGGRFATYDIVLNKGEEIYPTPWAHDASTSFLLTADDTRTALEDAGFEVKLLRDDTQLALDWFAAARAATPPAGPGLGVIIGPEFPTVAGNLHRNLREGRLGVLSAVLSRD